MSFLRHLSLNQKILFSVISVAFVMFSLVSALTVMHERDRMFEAANQDAHLDVAESISVISHDLWEFDNAALKASLKGITLSGSIIKAEVLDGEKIVDSFSRVDEDDKADSVWSVALMSPDDSRQIGTLRITESYADLRELITYNIIAVIAAELTKVAVLAAILFIIVHQLLTRHLKNLAKEIEATNTSDPNSISVITLDRKNSGKDELDTLVDAINRYRHERTIAEDELHQDIAQRKKIEAALQASEASLSDALKIARLGYWEYQIDRDQFTFNDQYYSLHHTTVEQVGSYEMSLADFAKRLLHPEDANSVVTLFQAAIDKTDAYFLSQTEARIACAGGDVRWVLIRFKVELDHAGKSVKLIGTNQDISDRKIAEDQTALLTRLSAQKEAAEIANQAKSRFLAAASHDLRQPIHALHLFLGTLKNLDLPLQAQRPLANVLRCTESIDEMFVSLLDVAKFDAGLITPQISDFPIMTILNRINHECTPLANAKGLRLDVVPSSAWIKSDPLMVERILRNLVTNAIRYTASGKIVVGCRRRPTNMLELAVYDTGIGIATDQQEKIFDEFYKAGLPDVGQAGLGLGLSIVDQLTKLLSAPLKLSSSEGTGSMFSVSFNMAVTGGIENLPPRLSEGKNLFDGFLVLVIDDDHAILEATKGLLEQWGCSVLTAENSQQAIKQLMASPNLPHALICDYRLRSKENGANAVRDICEEFNTDIPAMLITADTSPKRILQLQETGLLVLHKPLRDHELKEALATLLLPQLASAADLDQPQLHRPAKHDLVITSKEEVVAPSIESI